MNYFLSNLFRDKVLWGVLCLAALAGLIFVDLLTFMLMPQAVFNLWSVKITVGAAVVGAILYGLFLHQHEKKDKMLNVLLPDFLTERRALFEKMAVEDHEFQTFCHQCQHFDLDRLRCLLVLRERKAWIRLNDDSPLRYCLYWNLDDRNPVMLLTDKLKTDIGRKADGTRQMVEEEKMRGEG
jgi:hypothetical protein